MATQLNNILQGVSTNLAFALPGPFGAIVGAGITGLWGTVNLFAPSGPSEAEVVIKAIQGMIDGAVKELEGYMRQLNLEKAEGDAATFFEWYSENIAGLSDDALITQADVDLVEKNLLPKLEAANSFASGSLLNNLVSLSTDNYVREATILTARDQDEIMSVLMATMTALIAALKLQIRLHALCAAFYAPDPVSGRCENIDADRLFQDHVREWRQALEIFKHVIGPKPAELSDTLYRDDASSPWPPISLHRMNLGWIQPIRADANAGPTRPIDTIWREWVVQKNVNRNWDIHKPLRLPPPALFDSFDLNAAAVNGRAAALEQLALRRLLRRLSRWAILLELHVIAVFDANPDVEVWLPGRAQVLVSEKWDDSSATSGIRTGGHVEIWATAFLADQNFQQKNATTWFTDLGIIDGWRDGLQKILAMEPPARPGNTAVIHAWSDSDKPPADSEWATAEQVRYAFSFRADNTLPERSQWGSPLDVRGRWKPQLHAIEKNPVSGGKTEIWRQFREPNADAWRLPKIVATIDGTVTQYEDDDPATD
jgi:hypothetical protein